MKKLDGFRLSVSHWSWIAILTLPLLLSPEAKTLSNDERSKESPTTCPFRFADESFASSVRNSVYRLSLEHRPLLVHTRDQVGVDSLAFLREGEASNHTIQLHTPALYYNLKAISHLPVSVVAILAPDLPSQRPDRSSPLSPATTEALGQSLETLERARELVTEENFPGPGQVGGQVSIIDKTAEFIREVNESDSISFGALEEFGRRLESELRGNSRDAVSDYLLSLNSTISELLANQTLSSEEFRNLSVIVDLPPFSKPNSFIVQYYEQLLDYQYQVDTEDPNRIILSPYPSTDQDSEIANTFSNSELTHLITQTFYGPSEVFSSTHLSLSQAAEEIICSLELTFQSCFERAGRNEEKLPPGFSNPTERGYVVTIVFVGAFCVVLLIVVVCIFREGKVMRTERRTEHPLLSPGKSGIQTRNRNDGSASEEEEEGDDLAANRGAVEGEDPLISRGNFYRRLQSRRVRGRSSVKEPNSGLRHNRPSVTYSEVSVYQ